MAENSKIEWTDHTFNPWTGCTKISPACDHCYAEGWAKRSGLVEWGPHGDRRRTKTWDKPEKWNATLEGTGRRERVFSASLADVFDNHRSIDITWRMELWALIARTPNLDWLLLTKRPQNIRKMLPHPWNGGWENVWLGTTVENQVEADRRIPELLEVPAKVHFLSCEPLLGELDLTPHLWGSPRPCDGCPRDADCTCGFQPRAAIMPRNSINWVIAGGESGHGSRPSHPSWFRGLRDQCAYAGVPFHFKQWGDWISDRAPEARGARETSAKWHPFDDGECAWRIGKKKAGRVLDGFEHDGYPT